MKFIEEMLFAYAHFFNFKLNIKNLIESVSIFFNLRETEKFKLNTLIKKN